MTDDPYGNGTLVPADHWGRGCPDGCEVHPDPQPSEPERCMAVQGTAMSGPMYCGYRTTEVDKNGRPCCKRHLDKQLGIEWRGVNGDYPYGSGTYRHWTFKHGEFR